LFSRRTRNRPQKHHLAGGSSGPVAGKDIVFEILLDSLATPEIASFESLQANHMRRELSRIGASARQAQQNVLDGENYLLHSRVSDFCSGLVLSSRFAPSHRPELPAGWRQGDEIGIKSQADLEPVKPHFDPLATLLELRGLRLTRAEKRGLGWRQVLQLPAYLLLLRFSKASRTNGSFSVSDANSTDGLITPNLSTSVEAEQKVRHHSMSVLSETNLQFRLVVDVALAEVLSWPSGTRCAQGADEIGATMMKASGGRAGRIDDAKLPS
jgi:hypothetical protein